MNYKYCVVIGRFQPFHHGHYELVKTALQNAERAILVIGSAGKAPSIQNPWSADEREWMIEGSLTPEEFGRVDICHVRDYFYNENRWLAEVQNQVFETTFGNASSCDICYIGEKDYFPKWQFLKMDETGHPHATHIRDLYFTHDAAYQQHVAPGAVKYLESFKGSDSFKALKKEYDFIKQYRASWDGAPFPPVFVTADCVVVRSGHVLLVRRNGDMGHSLYALPGGFLNPKETIQECVFRELQEETGLWVNREEVDEVKVFDYPERSLRGRTITHAFLINLGNQGSLPKVKGADDASEALWVSLSDLARMEDQFFEDHFQIISHFVNRF